MTFDKKKIRIQLKSNLNSRLKFHFNIFYMIFVLLNINYLIFYEKKEFFIYINDERLFF